jgi:hypothetical protein
MDYKITLPDGNVESGTLHLGELKLIKLGLGENGLPLKAKAELEPQKNIDLGKGKGHKIVTELPGGVTGIVLDGRGRPFVLPEDDKTRVEKLREWMTAMDIYPAEALDRE